MTYIHIFCLIVSQMNLLKKKFSIFAYICSCELLRPATSSNLRPATPKCSYISHSFCRLCCHSSKTFLTQCYIVLLWGWFPGDTRLFSSSVLFGERKRPSLFILKKTFKNELLDSLLNISKLLRDNSTPTSFR